MVDYDKVVPVGTGLLVAEPQQKDVIRYANVVGITTTWEGDGWYDECRSWFESSYIHGGISGFRLSFSGPDAQRMISDLAINNVYKWRIGGCKHIVNVDDDGLIINHALFQRDGEDSFSTTAGNPGTYMGLAQSGKYDVKVDMKNLFIFQFSGPTSLTILEKLTRTDLHDVPFLGTKKTSIPELGLDVEVCRIGMSGTLAYEIRGPLEEGPRVYMAALEAGRPLGLKRLGWRSYCANHIYGGFPQMSCSFMSAEFRNPNSVIEQYVPKNFTGSVDPADERARYRTPGEVDWLWMAKFDHDFRGREAVEREAAHPQRTVKSLVWNPEDIIDIYRSLWDEDEPYKYVDFPSGAQQPAGGHQDHILTLDGKKVGWSSTPMYSSWYHTTISEACLDLDQAVDGTELIVKWGDYGHRMKDVRVRVERFPYIDVPDNRSYDLSTVAHGENL